jgi:hypothetical protein
VPLSEREKRILEEIEKNLYQEDPQFARGVKRESPRMADRRRVQAGGLLFVIGFATLIAFFVTGSVIVGVLAFGAMVGGIVVIAGSIKGSVAPRRPPGPAFGDRISQTMRSWEERFRQRYRRR